MKSFLRQIAILCLIALQCIAQPADEPLPTSIENFYPPKAPAPIYMFKMLELADAVSCVMVNFEERDTLNLSTQLDRLQATCQEVSALVPEWQSEFPLTAIAELATAARSGDTPGFFHAAERIGTSCTQCHVAHLADVQHRFHWPEFSGLSPTDPVTGKSLPFSQFKHLLAASFSGIGLSLREGQKQAAVRHFNEFGRRLDELAENCTACHDTPRMYYVDESVKAMTAQLGKALDSEPMDAKAVEGLVRGIGTASCQKCHLVHVPAALSHKKASK